MANKANLANSVLFAPLSDTDTTLEVYTGDGALFPAVPFYLTISPKNKWSRKINSEIVLVTARTGDTLTITRAQKGTTAMDFSYGDLLANGIYKEDLDELQSAVMQAMMPVGFVVTLGVSTNPATLYGFGTWTRVQGKVVVGLSDSDTAFDTLNETGGVKTNTLVQAQLPNVQGELGLHGGEGGSIFASVYGVFGGRPDVRSGYRYATGSGGSQSQYFQLNFDLNPGTQTTVNNLQPYITKYIWERTA